MYINKTEVLRYLGYYTLPDCKTEQLVEECILEINEFKTIGCCHKIFNIEALEEKVIVLNSAIELDGLDISNHLKHSFKCAIFAATLGAEVDSRIRYYKKADLAKAIIFDACATTAIENICDIFENKIRTYAKDQYDSDITSRFSPGYGDFPLTIQSSIINALNASVKIGLTVTENSILIPSKSVTAMIGITKEKNKRKNASCESCNIFEYCTFKKGENDCGN